MNIFADWLTVQPKRALSGQPRESSHGVPGSTPNTPTSGAAESGVYTGSDARADDGAPMPTAETKVPQVAAMRAVVAEDLSVAATTDAAERADVEAEDVPTRW